MTLDEMATLRARLDALESESAIRKLKADYMEGCDRHIGLGMADLFAPDGVWEGIGRFAGEFGATVGREAIGRQFAGDDKRLPLNAHFLTNEQIWVDGDRAKAKWMFLQPSVHAQHGAIWIAGRYEDDFTRIDGKWFIQHLRCGDIFVTTYKEGWAGFPCIDISWTPST